MGKTGIPPHNQSPPWREFLWLISVLAIQLLLLRFAEPIPAGGGYLFAVLLAMCWGLPFRSIAATFVGLTAFLFPLLLVRLLTNGPWLSVVLEWSGYLFRLSAAATVARAYLTFRGLPGVQAGFAQLLLPLPVTVRRTIGEIITGSILLLPVVLRRLQDARAAAKIRYSRGGTSTLRRTVLVIQAVIVSLSIVPQQRAEALVIRGLLSPEEEE